MPPLSHSPLTSRAKMLKAGGPPCLLGSLSNKPPT
jgi:hypothetical protein